MKQVYICNDTITGVYSALYDAWKENRNGEADIQFRGRTQQQMFCEYTIVNENGEKAFQLEKMIKRYLGDRTYREIYLALLSDDDGKGGAVFRTMQEARKIRDSRRIMEHLSNPDVVKVFELSRGVSNEAHLYQEFIRFRELEGGVLFSEITPKAQVLTCIADHFADRFPQENWMIYDKTHTAAVLHRKGERWTLIWGARPERRAVEHISEKEKEYEKLWKGFFDSIAIEGRKNPRLQKTHLPIRYREEMPEFSDKLPSNLTEKNKRKTVRM